MKNESEAPLMWNPRAVRFLALSVAGCSIQHGYSFTPSMPWGTTTTSSSTQHHKTQTSLYSTTDAVNNNNNTATSSSKVMQDMGLLQNLKSSLIQTCSSTTKPTLDEITSQVQQLESVAESMGVGQASSHSGLLSGEWELLYAPEDDTRSSPFFWAFRKAFPEASDQIFGITDAIPAPVKEIGKATQEIELDARSSTECGTLVSRVKVATLGGLATSIMTTRATLVGVVGLDTVRVRIDTTKPEDSTILEKLGPLGQSINEAAPAFPSGQALEQSRAGSSEVLMVTTFCDEGLRVTRYESEKNAPFVWRRLGFRGAMDL